MYILLLGMFIDKYMRAIDNHRNIYEYLESKRSYTIGACVRAAKSQAKVEWNSVLRASLSRDLWR